MPRKQYMQILSPTKTSPLQGETTLQNASIQLTVRNFFTSFPDAITCNTANALLVSSLNADATSRTRFSGITISGISGGDLIEEHNKARIRRKKNHIAETADWGKKKKETQHLTC